MFSPSTALAMTLHSMCQPGRPGPQGDGHAGSPGLEDFQRAKSAAERLPAVLVSEPVQEKPLVQVAAKGQEGKDEGRKRTFSILEQLPVPLTPRLQLRICVLPRLVPLPIFTLRSLKLDRIKPHAPTPLVREPTLDNPLDERDNFGDVLRHAGEGCRALDVKGGHGLEEGVFPKGGEVAENGGVGNARAELWREEREN